MEVGERQDVERVLGDDRLLDPELLKNLRVLVLPNIAALSDAQCAQLREFVRAGGGLVATFETSLFDEWGGRRKDFRLSAAESTPLIADCLTASGPFRERVLNVSSKGAFLATTRKLTIGQEIAMTIPSSPNPAVCFSYSPAISIR